MNSDHVQPTQEIEMTFNTPLRRVPSAAVFAISATMFAPVQAAQAQAARAKADIVLVDSRDQHAVRNVNNVLTSRYQMMINEDKAEKGSGRGRKIR
jgi:hypothetical protein